MTVHKVFIQLNNKGLQRIDPMKACNIDEHTGYSSNYVALGLSDRNHIQLFFSQ